MKITILGTANAWGPNTFLGTQWPMMGTLTTGKSVEIRKFRTSLLVETSDSKRILIDCGPDFGHQRRHFDIGPLDGILITHPHFDHIGGLDELNVYKPTKCVPIPTYAHKDCWTVINQTRGFGYMVEPLRLISENALRAFDPITIGAATIVPFAVEHSSLAPGAVGFSISDGPRRIVYTGDLWAICNPTHPIFREPADLLIMECDRFDGLAGPAVGGGHMSFVEAIRLLASGAFSNPRPKQVVFVHFGDNGPNGPRSTYNDWRSAITSGLTAAGLGDVMPDQDAVVGYEGLVL